jgi:hypothetical protein
VICGKNPNDIERIYNNMAIQITQDKKYDKVLLKDIYVDDNEFLPLFNHKIIVENSRNNKIIRYILGKIERFKGGLRDVNLSSETDTIEHILPQNPWEEWGEDNYDFDALVYRLGNLCLLEKNYNREIENKAYIDKIKVYRQSAFVTTKAIPEEYAFWNSESISKRQQQMGNCAKTIWKIDF